MKSFTQLASEPKINKAWECKASEQEQSTSLASQIHTYSITSGFSHCNKIGKVPEKG